MSTDLVDQIVRNVLAQLNSRAGGAVRTESTVATDNPAPSTSKIHLPPDFVPGASSPLPAVTSTKLSSNTTPPSGPANRPSLLKAISAVSGTNTRPSHSVPSATVPANIPHTGVTLTETVITAELLSRQARGASLVAVPAKAIITPAAKDWLRDHRVTLERSVTGNSPVATGLPARNVSSPVNTMPAKWVLGVVSATASVQTFLGSSQTAASVGRIAILGAGAEADEFVSGAIHKAEAHGAILIERSAAKRACLLNRSSAIRAAVVASLADVLMVSQDFSPNVYLIDPTLKTFIELRNLVQAIVRTGVPHEGGGSR